MASITLKELVEAGVHFGHRKSRRNPKMDPYIFARQGPIYLIDLRETMRGLLRAGRFLKHVVGDNNSLVLFVGTKRQAKEIITRAAQRCGMPYVAERWLGGTLTNFETIRSRMRRLEELEDLINSDRINTYSKKMIAAINREYRKMYRNLHGIRTLNRLPGAVFVVDPVREHNAVAEARKLQIPVVALIDTDGDPDLVDLPIPGNDDSMRSIEVIVNYIADCIQEAREASQPAEGEQPLETVQSAAGGQTSAAGSGGSGSSGDSSR